MPPEAEEWRLELGASGGDRGEEGGGESMRSDNDSSFRVRVSERGHTGVGGWALRGVTSGNNREQMLCPR